jgi:site-specific recombinase XerD
MLKGGVDPKLTADMLGHKSVITTLDLYHHVLVGMKETASEVLAEAVFGKE